MDSLIEDNLSSFLKHRKCTLLGVGPMSINCVDATIELANMYDVPIFLIASRRQVDSRELGGGYANNWTTEEFAKYVFERDKNKKILISRDHGGPWQNNKEQKMGLDLDAAMKSAKSSYKTDIAAGFKVLHIDPSVDIHENPSVDQILERVFDLYEFCWIEAEKNKSELIFEIGTEEQSGSTNTQEELDYTLNAVANFCSKNNLPKPTFVVIQCGTRVMEMRNVGSFDSPIRVANEIPAEIQLPKMIEICDNHGIFMKEHNTDYLSDEALRWHPRFGIHAANVAPEFGVTESCALVEILLKNNLSKLADSFLELAYLSRKWEKWMLVDSSASDKEKSLIAGHYIFSTPEFIKIKKEAVSELSSKNIDLDNYLKERVKSSILRYMYFFRLINPI